MRWRIDIEPDDNISELVGKAGIARALEGAQPVRLGGAKWFGIVAAQVSALVQVTKLEHGLLEAFLDRSTD